MQITFNYLLCIFSLFILNLPAIAQNESFDIQNLIKIIPFEEVIENEEITSEQLSILLNNNKNSSYWQLDKYNKSIIIFHNNYEKWILKTYPISENKQLLLINTQLGNHGQTHNFTFFIYDEISNSLSKEIERAIYIPNVKENDFLTKNQKFNDSEEGYAVLHMNDDGTISAAPKTWMNPKWENKNPAYTIKFEWKNNRFVKIKKKI